MIEILNMSGYAVYVWSAVGIVVFSLGLIAWHARLTFKRVQAKINWGRDAQS